MRRWNDRQAAEIHECTECGDRCLPADERRWQAFLTVDDELNRYRSTLRALADEEAAAIPDPRFSEDATGAQDA